MRHSILLLSTISSLILTGCVPKPFATSINKEVRIVNVDSGWANNSVNTTVFRRNSIVSLGDIQYIAFYNNNGNVVLGKRKIGDLNWDLKTTAYKGNVIDAHNIINIMVDGDGYLHMSWNHHNDKIHYIRSLQPGSFDFTPEMSMIGKNENSLSYPDFYRMPDGSLLFLYRNGSSGKANTVLNKYNLKTKEWTSLHENLIDGEGERNAYWQAFIDSKGVFHLSWVWRESAGVESNHDLSYARSRDGGVTWEKSTGEKYTLPIRMAPAERIWSIPEKSELVNQTSMFVDDSGRPFIATYWRDQNSTVPQFRLVYKSDSGWQSQNLGFRSTPFTLSGERTKRIPISRPQIVGWQEGSRLCAAIIFRDEERKSRVSAAISTDIQKGNWKVIDLDDKFVGSWEPTYVTELWKRSKLLHLFVQRVEQIDAEGRANLPPQMVEVFEWKPLESSKSEVRSQKSERRKRNK